MKPKIIFTLILFITISISGFCITDITFGNKENQVGFRAPISAEDFPEGPNSFRMCNGNLWIADSVNRRIIALNSEGKLVKSIVIPELPKDSFISDFCFQFSSKTSKPVAILVLDQYSLNIYKVSLSGKLLMKIPGKNNLIQADEIACDRDGQIYVGDLGAGKITVYSPAGKYLRKVRWHMASFVVDKDNNLYLMSYNKIAGNILSKYNQKGDLVDSIVLGLANMQNPNIWNVDENGNIMISYTPPSGNPTAQILIEYSNKGKVVSKMPFTNPYYISRYLLFGENKVWLVKANYALAPKRNIRIIELTK